VGQLHQLPNRHILIESCPTKIFLPNPDAKAEESRRLYAELGLNDREIELIAESVPKQHYYFKSPRGSRRFELALGPVALSFLASFEGTTMEETRRRVESLAARYGPGWPRVWLKERGLEEWADQFKPCTGEQDEKSWRAA
jgi:type IV secretion system protein TrbE